MESCKTGECRIKPRLRKSALRVSNKKRESVSGEVPMLENRVKRMEKMEKANKTSRGRTKFC